MKFKRIMLILTALLMLLSCAACKRGNDKIEGEYAIKDIDMSGAGYDPHDNRVFYEIFVGSFSDSNGDGVGDLRGIINRMDYLNDGDPASGKSLGVEGLWLTPIFKSPSYHKYDINDYYTIDPSFGTMDDLKELVDICHQRGVYVILDLPINHTGRGNEWYTKFAAAHKEGNTEDPYYDFYAWYDPETEDVPYGRTFSKIVGSTHYYECNFTGDMPELNFDNEFVRQTVVDVAKFYLDLGVDGFRFDAAKYIYFGNNAQSLEFWSWYMDELRAIDPDIYTVAEVWDGDGTTDIYYKALNCFNFSTSQSSGIIAQTANKGNVNAYTSYFDSYLKHVKSLREGATIVPFITNHDMDRAAGFLTVASGGMQMAANLYLLGPGSPFIYYGEEIGMRGSRGSSNTDANRRLAMLWGDGDTVKDPVGTNYPADKQSEYTVEMQLSDPSSLYTHYKKLLMIRKAYPAISCGEYTPIKLEDTKVGGFSASLDGKTVVVLHNTTGSKQTIDLAAAGITASNLLEVIGMEDASIEEGVLTIGSLTSVVMN